MEYVFQVTERIFHDVECLFHVMEYRTEAERFFLILPQSLLRAVFYATKILFLKECQEEDFCCVGERMD